MATNEELRRASGRAMEQSRRNAGRINEATRRAGGQAMIEERTGKAVVEDINRLTRQPATRKPLSPIAPVGALPASRGRGVYKPPAASTGGGIASPLTEASYAGREWWPGGLPSSDGLFVLPAVKRIVMTDANGAEVIFDYAEPV
ncbi:hypothetical protein [Stutzerimonas stutzeri]|uniref:hypothetical protein n=1 Tax=Stutzerimonas stutzeri TaxID=316 RepID=UPI000C9A957B|nr:hypothetical protein [Stutzerimonas stutzeri]PNG11865.1 hypothetical protein CXK97_19260 [Stutzerimonas stutzeri]